MAANSQFAMAVHVLTVLARHKDEKVKSETVAGSVNTNPVVIRRLTSGNTSYPPAPDLQLPVHTTALRIEYTALSLSIPERVRFRHQLVGSDTGWQDAGGRREAFYTNLGPGSYRFRVIAANDDGVWNHLIVEVEHRRRQLHGLAGVDRRTGRREPDRRNDTELEPERHR